jgi:hypothetical protein
MTRLFMLEPEVDGTIGPASRGDLRARPLRLSHFHYAFDVRPADPLPEAIRNYIVTDALRERLVQAGASGAAFANVEVTKSGIFEDMKPRPPPRSGVIGQPRPSGVAAPTRIPWSK